jgi:hypothetical protein
MLNNIALSADDTFWASILSDLGADVSNRGIRFAAPGEKISVPELSRRVEKTMSDRIRDLGATGLSEAERRLVLMLPATARELKSRMGYAESSATHTVETLICNIRKKIGQEFITTDDGAYRLNK